MCFVIFSCNLAFGGVRSPALFCYFAILFLYRFAILLLSQNHLKAEIEVFITSIFLRILESEHSVFEHKVCVTGKGHDWTPFRVCTWTR